MSDVLTGLASATFPDGSTPEVIDVVRVATNVFAAGQETTVRLLSSALKVLGERPDIQALLRIERDRIPNFIEETLRIESPVKGDFRLSRVPTTVGGVDIPAGTTVMVMNGAANRDPRQFEQPTNSMSLAQMPVVTLHSGAVSIPVPARRLPVRNRGCFSNACSTAPPTSGFRRTDTVSPMPGATPTCRPTSCAA